MSARWRVLILALFVGCPAAASAQSAVDPFDFLEEWDLIGQDVRNGKLELTPEGLPQGFDTKASKLSEDGLFQVRIEPENGKVPLNQIHTWLVDIDTPDGAPVRSAEVSFYGAMPLHRHGFPTDPRIVGEVDPGVYALQGMKYSMAGWWTIGLGIVAADKTDRVMFNVLYEP